ncbi:Uncharacterized protein At4g02000 [Linum perenne]
MLPTPSAVGLVPPMPVADPKGRPPDDAPRSGPQNSYLRALRGSAGPQPPMSQSWIPVGISDIVPSCTNGIKALSLSHEFKEKLCKPWSHSVVVRLLGKTIGYTYLCHRLHSMWKPAGSMHIVDLDRSCFLVKFTCEQDYFKALTGGPWMLLDHYLAVHQWDPSFRVTNELPKTMVAWVRFPHLPIHFYHGQVLTSLGNLVGKTVKIDFNTQTAERGKFARIAIEIDLDKPLPPVVLLDGTIQQIEYENLPNLCFECGRVGHERSDCPSRIALIALEQQPKAPPGTGEAVGVHEPPAADGFGPWMMASRRSRRPAKESVEKKESSSRREGKEQIKESEPRKSSSKIPSDKRAVVRTREESPKIKEGDGAEALTTHKDRDPSIVGKGNLHGSGDMIKRKRKNKKKNKAKPANGPSLGPEDPLNQMEGVQSKSGAGEAGGSSSGRPDPSEPTTKANESSPLFAGLFRDPGPVLTNVSVSSSSFSRMKASVPSKEKKKGDKLKPRAVVSRKSDSGLSKKSTKVRVLEDAKAWAERESAKEAARTVPDENPLFSAEKDDPTAVEAAPMALDTPLDALETGLRGLSLPGSGVGLRNGSIGRSAMTFG